MKTLKIITIAALSTLMLVACKNNRDQLYNEISQMEESNSMALIGADDDYCEKMLSLYRGFVAKFPTDSLAPVYMVRTADIQITLNNIDEAIATLDSVIALYPGYDDLGGCYFLKGVAYENSEQFDNARNAYETMLKLYPDHVMASDVKKMLPYLGLSPEEMFAAIMANAADSNLVSAD